MAKGQHLSNYQQKIVKGYYDNRDTLVTHKLGQIVSDLYVCTNPKETGKLWARARETLVKTSADQARVAKLLAEKNIEELARVVGELTTGSGPVVAKGGGAQGASAAVASTAPVGAAGGNAGETPATRTSGGAAAAGGDIAPETLRSAMTAFRKRLKLTRLNEESRLSPRPMTGGKKSEVVGIIPPDQFPRTVWDELARQEKLRYTGRGFYELVE